jgi:hypothetical protein
MPAPHTLPRRHRRSFIPAPPSARSGTRFRAAGHALQAHGPDAARSRRWGHRPRRAPKCARSRKRNAGPAGPAPRGPRRAGRRRRSRRPARGAPSQAWRAGAASAGSGAASELGVTRASAHYAPGAASSPARGSQLSRGATRTAMQHALAGGRKREAKSFGASKHSRAPAKGPKPRSGPEMRRAQERVLREQEARTWQAHQAADRAKAAPTASPQALDPDAAGASTSRGAARARPRQQPAHPVWWHRRLRVGADQPHPSLTSCRAPRLSARSPLMRRRGARLPIASKAMDGRDGRRPPSFDNARPR